MHALINCNLVEEFHERVIGYMDTRKLFRMSFPSLKSFSQVNLSKDLLGPEFTYAAHNALEDVRTLKKLVCLPSVLEEHKQLCEFSADYILESVEFNARVKKNLPSLQILINLKVVSAGIARKIAGSDLSFRHLEVVFRRDGQDGLSTMLAESVSGKIRVSRSKKMIASLCDYFSGKS